MMQRFITSFLMWWHGWRWCRVRYSWLKTVHIETPDIEAIHQTLCTNGSRWCGNEPHCCQIAGVEWQRILYEGGRTTYRTTYRVIPIPPETSWPYQSAEFEEILP